MQIRFTPQARRDLSEILKYTDRKWGRKQRDIYKYRFAKAVSALSSNPELGVSVDDVAQAVRAHSVESHILYYRIIGNVVEIVRILHERLDASRYLTSGT